MDSLLRYINRGRCENLIKYQTRIFEFKETTAEFPGGKITFGGVSTELRNLDSIAETARALNDFHYLMCSDLSNPTLKQNLTSEDLRLYTKILLGAHACILNLRSTLDSYRVDPQNQAQNLDKSVQLIRNYVNSVTPGLITEEARKAMSDALSSVGIYERDVDKALSK